MIDTLVFDYGGVIVNLDDAAVMSALDSLGINALKKLLYAYRHGFIKESERKK